MLVTTCIEPVAEEVEALGLDPTAFRAFYDEALARIYGYLLHRCGGNASVAEDLTQETFLAAVCELKKGQRVEAPLPWIYGIARHKLLDHYRRQERGERILAIESNAEIGDVPFEGGQEARERAVAALAVLPASQREALVLRYLDGFSPPEVAAALGKSVKAIDGLIARGRESFKRAYLEVSS